MDPCFISVTFSVVFSLSQLDYSSLVFFHLCKPTLFFSPSVLLSIYVVSYSVVFSIHHVAFIEKGESLCMCANGQ